MSLLSERIRAAMAAKGITQAELARAVGLRPPSIHGWLTGKAKFLRGENLLRAAEALGVRQEWLATGHGEMQEGAQKFEEYKHYLKVADPELAEYLGAGDPAPQNPHPEWGAYGTAEALIPGAKRVVVSEDDPHSYKIQKVKLQLRAGVTGFQTIPEIHDGGTINLPKNWVDRKGFFPETLIAISIVGESMEPRLFEDDVVVINTADRKLVDGEVYAVNYEGEAVVKRLVRERGEWWLFSDNPDQARYRPRGCREGECNIIGRVVWKGSERI